MPSGICLLTGCLDYAQLMSLSLCLNLYLFILKSLFYSDLCPVLFLIFPPFLITTFFCIKYIFLVCHFKSLVNHFEFFSPP